MNRKNKNTKIERRFNINFIKSKTFVFVSAFLSFLFLVFGIPIIINESYKLNAGYATLWDASDALSFYAVILSGIITIGALITTLIYSKKDTERQINFSKSQKNVPFFIINCIYQEDDDTQLDKSGENRKWQNEYTISKFGKKPEKVAIFLKNIGDGIAINPIYSIDLLPNNSSVDIPKIVVEGGTLKIIYNLQSVLDQKVNKNKLMPFDIRIKLIYQNTLGIKFEQEFIFHHKWNTERSSVFLFVNNVSTQRIY